MRTELVCKLFLTCYCSRVVAMNPNFYALSGIKLCGKRHEMTGLNRNIKLKSGTVYCQMDTESTSEPQVLKGSWKYVPTTQCEEMYPEFSAKPKPSSVGRKANGKAKSQRKRITCKAGLSYDPKGKACVKVCKRYGKRMRIYKGYSILGNNDANFRPSTLAECERKCITMKRFLCKSFDFGRDFDILQYNCMLSSKAYFEVAPKDRQKDEGWVLGVRTCKP